MLEIHAVNGEMKSYNELYSEHNYSFENLSLPQLCDIFCFGCIMSEKDIR